MTRVKQRYDTKNPYDVLLFLFSLGLGWPVMFFFSLGLDGLVLVLPFSLGLGWPVIPFFFGLDGPVFLLEIEFVCCPRLGVYV